MKNLVAIILLLFFVVNTARAQQKNFGIEPTASCKIIAPNAFTPNNDGVNDLFYVSLTGSCNLVTFEMKIFDRWGRLVFEANEITETWDGTYDGRQLKEGVYLWQVSATWVQDASSAKTTEAKNGSLVLIR